MRSALSGLLGIFGLYVAVPGVPTCLLVLTGIIGRQPDQTPADAVTRAWHTWMLGSLLLVGVVSYGLANLLAPQEWGGRLGRAYGSVSVAVAVCGWLVLSFALWDAVSTASVGWFGVACMAAAWAHFFLTGRATAAKPAAPADRRGS